MNSTELVMEGLNLMFAGMGFVIGFLILLILAISLMSNLINRFFPEPAPAQAQPTIPIKTDSDDLEHLRPVIVAAIAHHRRQQGLN
ncbi:oxaloacetate decarboxylase gamma chain [Pasteurellaceae bacterium 15-036681]|nr:oxaloacetate decarboxylase gamma chain [Pasteurellaceae bacterium 15-036681]